MLCSCSEFVGDANELGCVDPGLDCVCDLDNCIGLFGSTMFMYDATGQASIAFADK